MSLLATTVAQPRAAFRGAPLLLPALAVCLMLALAPLQLLSRELWTDEAYTASYVTHASLGAVLGDVRRNEETPPMYFVVAWLWVRLVGERELSLRLLSLLCGGAAVAAFAGFVQRVLAPKTAVLAALLFATLPLISQNLVEARGYTLTLLLATLSLATFERLYWRPLDGSAILPYVAATTALLLTSYFGVALLLAHTAAWAARLRRRKDLTVACIWYVITAMIGGTVALWLPNMLYQLRVAPAVTATWHGGLLGYFWMLLSAALGARPAATPALVVWLLGAGVVWECAVLGVLAGHGASRGLLQRGFAIPAIMLACLVVWMEATEARYLMVLAPGLALAAAVGLCTLAERSRRIAQLLGGVALIGALAAHGREAGASAQPQPWSELSRRVETGAQPGDVVLIHPPWDQRVFDYYYRGPGVEQLGAYHYDDFYYHQGYDLRTSWTTAEAERAVQHAPRVWVVYNQLSFQVPRLQLPYRQVGRWQYGRLELLLYDTRTTGY